MLHVNNPLKIIGFELRFRARLLLALVYFLYYAGGSDGLRKSMCWERGLEIDG